MVMPVLLLVLTMTRGNARWHDVTIACQAKKRATGANMWQYLYSSYGDVTLCSLVIFIDPTKACWKWKTRPNTLICDPSIPKCNPGMLSSHASWWTAYTHYLLQTGFLGKVYSFTLPALQQSVHPMVQQLDSITLSFLPSKNVYGLPRVPETKTPKLDGFMRSEVSPQAKAMENQMAKAFVFDAVAPLTYCGSQCKG